jgi:hypothetical protein
MNDDWTEIDHVNKGTWPPEGVEVSTMDSGGHVQSLTRKGNMFWFPDMTMYVYYCPKRWKKLATPTGDPQ